MAKKHNKPSKKDGGAALRKRLRDKGAEIAELTANPLVADLIAAGLVALAARIKDRDASGAQGVRSASGSSSHGLTNGLGEAAAVLASIFGARSGEPHGASAAEGKSGKKKDRPKAN